MFESIGSVKAVSGKTVYGSLDFEGKKIPVVITRGASEGPTLLVLGVQHATEFSGPAAIDAALELIDPAALRGTLVCIPFCNPVQLKFNHKQHGEAHRKPETNLNRQWPGDGRSENELSRLAALLWEEAVKKSDAVIDFHCCRTVDPRFAAAQDGHKPSEDLALASGLEAVDLQTANSYAEGMLFVEAAKQLDIPAELVESFPGGFQIREAVEACCGVMMRSMVHMGMLESWSPPERTRVERPPMFHRSESGKAMKNKGFGYPAPRRWPGDRVNEGECVAVLRSVETFEVAEEFNSPLTGAVGCVGDPASGGFVEPDTVVAAVKRVD